MAEELAEQVRSAFIPCAIRAEDTVDSHLIPDDMRIAELSAAWVT